MRKIILPLFASLAFAAPAMAGETRAEVRGGVIWTPTTTEDTWGAAVGYDADLGPLAFAGAEVSGDKIGTNGTKVAWGLTGRLGLRAATGTKVFAAAGYTTEACDLCRGQVHAGAGLEQKIAGPFYVKGEYRHFFENDMIGHSDALVAGVGIKF